MRLLIVLPKQQEVTGNDVTSRRLQSSLQDLGFTVTLLAISPDENDKFTAAIDRFHPDSLLLLHAWRCGQPWLSCPAATSCPTTVLLTGTDINHDIDDPEKGVVINEVLQRAAAIVSQNRQTVVRLQKQKPSWIDRLHYIPPGVLLGNAPYPLREKHGISEQCRLFLHPAGIRPVKANLELLKLCDPLAERNPTFAIAFCGPALDPDYFNEFLAAIDQRSWAHYLGIISADAMPDALAEADLILNNSISEGISNALIEALAVGRPILARNIPGNAAVHQSTEYFQLYDSDPQFIELAERFISSPSAKVRATTVNRDQFSASLEAKLFISLFNSL